MGALATIGPGDIVTVASTTPYMTPMTTKEPQSEKPEWIYAIVTICIIGLIAFFLFLFIRYGRNAYSYRCILSSRYEDGMEMRERVWKLSLSWSIVNRIKMI